MASQRRIANTGSGRIAVLRTCCCTARTIDPGHLDRPISGIGNQERFEEWESHLAAAAKG